MFAKKKRKKLHKNEIKMHLHLSINSFCFSVYLHQLQMHTLISISYIQLILMFFGLSFGIENAISLLR